ncbi:efflux RND transporter periplasmic adaptor subunit [Propionivibrio dicarboxylicus]|uniref:HlyD family secretion protein n=1 Tax=Propionivibrio dicarboxylicus TaxID=83767 RepID=A0A1G8F132_9RHOO|nr:efflux RND transporter periplasmic adaptor subunit [Propionivibrio dicarboxylicus]SDH75851.1 HlyD family secretion protein [Propionivibrio dicarboxylicus]
MKLTALFTRQSGLWLVGLLLLLGFGFVGVRSGPLAPIRVTTVSVETGLVTPALFGIATVEARRSYFIGPTAAGRVRSLQVDVGDRVKAGQNLAEIDPVDLDERIRSMDASYARAHSALIAAEAQRKDGLARKDLASLNARRYLDLGEKKFVSTSAVEGKQQELISAQAALESADANLLGARQELSRLNAEQAALHQQRKNLFLLAPRNGIVTSRDAEPGSTVIAGQSVLKLIDPDSLWLKVRLDQGRSRGLVGGLKAEIVLRANPGITLPGKVVRVEPLSDAVTEERIAFVAFDTVPSDLTVGELAEVTIHVAPGPMTLILPNAAIKHTVRGAGVWRLQNDQPTFVPVTLGLSGLDGHIQILGGLQEGDRVIAYSEKELSDSSRVRVEEQLVGGKH